MILGSVPLAYQTYVLSVAEQALILNGDLGPVLKTLAQQNAEKLQCIGDPVLPGLDPKYDDLSQYYKNLGTLVAKSTLKSIKFQYYIFSRPELKAFMSTFKDSKVVDVEISHCKISTAKGVIILDALRESNVRNLSLKNNHISSLRPGEVIGADEWRAFCRLLSQTPITQLDLQGNHFWLQALVILSLNCYNCALVGIDFGQVSSLSWGDSFLDGFKVSYKFWYQGVPINLSRLNYTTEEHHHVMPKNLSDVQFFQSLVESNPKKLFKLGQVYGDLKHQAKAQYFVPLYPIVKTSHVSRVFNWVVKGISSWVYNQDQKNAQIHLPRDVLSLIIKMTIGEYRMKNPYWIKGYLFQKRQHELVQSMRKVKRVDLKDEILDDIKYLPKPLLLSKTKASEGFNKPDTVKDKKSSAIMLKG